jgi:hypothetical protein
MEYISFIIAPYVASLEVLGLILSQEAGCAG